MRIGAIRAAIELAKQHETATGDLRAALLRQLPTLHVAIQLPHTQPVEALLAFVTAYIEHVPACLEATAAIARAAQIDTQAGPLLQLAEDYFLEPSALTDAGVGLTELMNEAYLAHRLLEEINDYYQLQTGVPLIPLDMTVANLIGHHLIGEPFANELDEAVHFSIEQLLQRHPASHSDAFLDYIDSHRGDRWARERQTWPCLTRQLAVDLQLVGF